MYNRRYDKVFLMLRQETAGYSMGQRAPWGSCVMEIKNGLGRISLTVQGLRPIRRGRYAVYAIAGEQKGQNNFFCGVLNLDTAGHGELKWEFNPDNLEGKNVTAEDLNTVAILAESDGGFSVPLTAYFGGKVEWRTYFKASKGKSEERKEEVKIIKEAPKAKKETPEVTLVAAEASTVNMPSFTLPKVELKKDEPKVESPKPKVEKQESYHGSFRGLLEKFRQELEELQDTGVFSEKDMERIDRAGRRNHQKEVVMANMNSNTDDEEKMDGNLNNTNVLENVQEVQEMKKMQEMPGTQDMNEVREMKKMQEMPGTQEMNGIQEMKKMQEMHGTQELNGIQQMKKMQEIPGTQEVHATQKMMKEIEEMPQTVEMVDTLSEKYALLKDNKNIFPFGDEDSPWKWISLEETVVLEDFPVSWMKDYFFLMPMKKYHHYIWRPEVEGYSLGIPGEDTADNRARAKELGFNEFRKMENDDLGYWIMSYK